MTAMANVTVFDLDYAVRSLSWLVSGMIIGYILRDLREALTWGKGALMTTAGSPAPGDDAKTAAPAKGTPKPGTHRQNVKMQVLGFLLLIAVIVSVVLDWQNSGKVQAASRAQLAQAAALHKLTECQANVNQQFLEAIKGRSTAANLAQDALTHLIGTIPTSVAGGADFARRFHVALVSYDDTIARINQERPKLPPLPAQVCH